MTTFERSELKANPLLQAFFDLVKSKHEVADHTKEVLYKNRKVKNFCEEARHYVELAGKNPLYIHYDASSWYHTKESIIVKIERIAFYDNYQEYQAARLKGLYASPKSSVNLN